MTFVPAFLSEFPDVHVDDCVPASGVMLVDKITHNKYPASIAEREALQNAMGTQDAGADALQLCDGIRKRYGISLLPVNGWSTLATALAMPNKGAAIFGGYQKLPAYIRSRGNQPMFNGGHCLYAQGDGAGGVVIGDPLGNAMISGMAINDLQPFAGLFGSDMAVIAQESLTQVGYRVNIPASTTGETLTFFHVMRFTHTLYGAKRVTFAPRGSHAAASHGAPGFWRIIGGYLDGYYLVAGKSGAFTASALYSDGSMRPLNINS